MGDRNTPCVGVDAREGERRVDVDGPLVGEGTGNSASAASANVDVDDACVGEGAAADGEVGLVGTVDAL